MTFADLLRRLFGSAEEAIVRRIAGDPEKLGLSWRTNIVDLLKVLDLDTSQDARRELAADLAVEYDEQDEAANRRLQTAVMGRLQKFGQP